VPPLPKWDGSIGGNLEDCLYMNIYAPVQTLGDHHAGNGTSETKNNSGAPVWVFLHGTSSCTFFFVIVIDGMWQVVDLRVVGQAQNIPMGSPTPVACSFARLSFRRSPSSLSLNTDLGLWGFLARNSCRSIHSTAAPGTMDYRISERP
jgi:hypothetical protein